MKFGELETSPKTNLIDNENSFTIKSTGKAFQILSSQIYSNKVGAIIRELSCNALDAHIAASKQNVPFEVHLPSRENPYFSVKDFGIGLSNEQVINLYTTYFESTKNGSNDFIGAFGLGSKSPFCYTNTFQVVSRFDSIVSTYSCYLTDEGTPSISLLKQELTVEQNGVEVIVPVNMIDQGDFYHNAKLYLQHFKVQPIIKNADIDISMSQPMYQGTNWKFYGSPYNAITIIQGSVPYRLEMSQIYPALDEKLKHDSALLRDVRRMLYGLDMVIEVPIGYVEVAASREALSYNKKTIENLSDVVVKVFNELRKTVFESFENYGESDWYKKIAIKRFIAQYDKLFNAIDSSRTLASQVDEIKISNSNYNKLQVSFKENGTKQFAHNPFSNYYVPPDKDTFIIINDNNKIVRTDIKRHVEKTSNWQYSNVYVFSTMDYIQLVKDLGSPAYVKTSDLRITEKKQRVKKDVIYTYRTSNNTNVYRTREPLPEKGTYIVYERDRPKYKNNTISYTGYILEYAIKNGFIDKDQKIFLFTSSEIKKLKNWTELFAQVEEDIQQELQKNLELSIKRAQLLKINGLDYVTRWIYALQNNSSYNLIEHTSLDNYVKAFKEYDEIKTNGAIENIANTLNIKIKQDENNDEVNIFADLKNKVLIDYPMLELIWPDYYNDKQNDSKINKIIDYILLVEQNRKK